MLRQWLLKKAKAIMASRPYDFAIGVPNERYCLRWWVIPRNRWFNIYLHHFLHDDEDRALHDHPWPSISFLLQTGYYEVIGIPSRKVWRREGSVTFRHAATPHRIVLDRRQMDDGSFAAVEAISLFITGSVIRNWGFHCPKAWVPWQQFVDSRDKGAVGRGCD
jgi:hypothetical protein